MRRPRGRHGPLVRPLGKMASRGRAGLAVQGFGVLGGLPAQGVESFGSCFWALGSRLLKQGCFSRRSLYLL